MATKKYVSIKVDLKDTSIKALKPDAIKKCAADAIAAAIDSSSGLTTKTKNPDGFVLTATINTLKVDDNDNPKTMEFKAAIVVIAVGSTATGFTGNAGGKEQGVDKDIQKDAENLITQVLKSFMTGKAIPAMK